MKKVKALVAIGSCFILTAIIYMYMCLVFSPKSIEDSGGKTFYRGMGFMAEPKNSIEVMVYGNSDVYSGFSPAKLYEKYGYVSYASGTAVQTISKINKLLDKTLETQKPKMVILEVDCLYEKRKEDFDNSNFMIAPFVFHARWKELKSRDFYTIPDRTKKYDITKGYVHSEEVYNYKAGDYMGSANAKPLPIPRRNLHELKYFIKTCKENDIKVVFLELPSASSWSYAKHNYIKDIAKKINVPFIDLNVKKEDYAVDFSRDFRDKGNHMNLYGAEKATEYVGKYLAENYNEVLSDRRNDKQYVYWKKVLEQYNKTKSTGLAKK